MTNLLFYSKHRKPEVAYYLQQIHRSNRYRWHKTRQRHPLRQQSNRPPLQHLLEVSTRRH